MPLDITKAATGEGQPVGSVAAIGASNQAELGRLAGGSVADTANANAVGGMLVVHRFDIPDAPGAVDRDFVFQHKEQMIDAWAIKTTGAGGAGDTWQLARVEGGPIAITDSMSLNVADTSIVRPSTINDAGHIIGAGQRLRIITVKASAANVAYIAYVLCLRVA